MSKVITTSTIFNYLPNYIGYSRIITAIISFYLMKSNPIWCIIVYSISCLLDAADGYIARSYNQTSQFGAVLDMVTDRCTTSSLICFLCILYPQYSLIFQLLISLDLSSHYMHMYATLISGNKSHKSIDKESSWLLNLYYTNRIILFIMCAFNELFYVTLYLYYFKIFNVEIFGFQISIVGIIAIISLPFYLFKQTANIIQLYRASIILAESDVEIINKKN